MHFVQVDALSSASGPRAEIDNSSQSIIRQHVNDRCAIFISGFIDTISDAIQRVRIEDPLVKQKYKEAAKDHARHRDERDAQDIVFRDRGSFVKIWFDIRQEDRGDGGSQVCDCDH